MTQTCHHTNFLSFVIDFDFTFFHRSNLWYSSRGNSRIFHKFPEREVSDVRHFSKNCHFPRSSMAIPNPSQVWSMSRWVDGRSTTLIRGRGQVNGSRSTCVAFGMAGRWSVGIGRWVRVNGYRSVDMGQWVRVSDFTIN